MKSFLSLCLMLLAFAAGAVEWKGVDPQHHLGGRKASAGYLQGKVVFVVRWTKNCDETREMLRRVEEIWENFKTKQFVVLGSCCVPGVSAAEATAFVRSADVAYPCYSETGLAAGAPNLEHTPLYVVDETGKVVYLGKEDRNATQAIVGALTDMDSPRNLKQWKRFLDYELEHLPAHAYNRLNEFRKKFPDESGDYLEKARTLVALTDVKAVAELVEFSKRATDSPEFGSKDKEKHEKLVALVDEVLEKCTPLKSAADPRLRQEAKNAIADLVWKKASL